MLTKRDFKWSEPDRLKRKERLLNIESPLMMTKMAITNSLPNKEEYGVRIYSRDRRLLTLLVVVDSEVAMVTKTTIIHKTLGMSRSLR